MKVSGEGDEITLPGTAPVLPEPVDGLWPASWSADGRVIAWLPHAGWIEGRTV
jgi:hypothetical protein